MSSASLLTGLIVCLDDVPLDDLVGPVEVLIQEGLHSFSLPGAYAELGELVSIFGARARFGAHAVTTEAQVRAVAGAGGDFIFLDLADASAIGAADELGLAVAAPAMTPTEIRQVLDAGIGHAMLYPADVVGHMMAHRLAPLGLVDRVIPRAGIGAYAAGEWFKAGAPAVCLDTNVLGDALTGGDLGLLRDRCPAFVQVVSQNLPS